MNLSLPGLGAMLPTFHQPPSWCNTRGGIDRSACIEIRVSELRRLAGCVIIDRKRRDARRRALHLTAPLPDERTRGVRRTFADGSQRLSSGTFTINARDLHNLHTHRLPRTLAGDYRTSRANVMQRTPLAAGSAGRRSFRTRITHTNPVAWPPDRNIPSNPNKGAARTKIIGLPAEWSQPLRIEKWLYPNRIRPAYFLICSSHTAKVRNKDCSEARLAHRFRQNSNHHTAKTRSEDRQESCFIHRFRQNSKQAAAPPAHTVIRSPSQPPPLSTRPPGREHPSSKKCPQRCLKLLMVQCTPAEHRDAMIAQQMIEFIHSLPNATRLLTIPSVLSTQYSALFHRYGLLFSPRTLLCPRCLRVRYGNNPETVRQGWRRRNKKSDTTLAGRIAREVNLGLRRGRAFLKSEQLIAELLRPVGAILQEQTPSPSHPLTSSPAHPLKRRRPGGRGRGRRSMMVLPPSVLRAPKIKLELPPELADEPELLPGLTLIRCIGALNHRRDRLDAAVAKHMRLLEWRARCVKQGRDPRGRKNRVAHSEPGRVAHSEPGRVAPATG